MPKLSRLLPKEIKQLKFETQLKFDSIILGVRTSMIKVCIFPKSLKRPGQILKRMNCAKFLCGR